MPSIDGTRAVVQRPDGKVLLLRRPDDAALAPGTWCFPGGALDPGELPLDCAIRELYEETSIVAGPQAQASMEFEHPAGVGMAFLFSEGYAVPDPLLQDESEGFAWYDPRLLPDLVMPGTAAVAEWFFGGPTEIIQEKASMQVPSELPGTASMDDQEVLVEVRQDSSVLESQTRIDRGEFRAPKRTPEGFLKADVYATRVGVLVYLDSSGNVRRELRLPEHVFRPESLETLAEKPVTDQHPRVGLLTSENATQFAKGWTGAAVERDGDFVRTTVTVVDEGLIKKAVAGARREVSCGYLCDLVMQSGKWRGQEYDAIQTNIRYNHLAMVDKGRAGPEVRLRMDASEQIDPHEDSHKEENTMLTKITLDGQTHEVPAPVAAALTALQARLDGAAVDSLKARLDEAEKKATEKDEEIEDAKAKAQEAEDEKAKAEAKADAAQAELAALQTKLDAFEAKEAMARLDSLKSVAAPFLAKDFKFDGLDEVAIKREVVKAKNPKLDAAKLDNESYVEAAFDLVTAAGGAVAARNDSTQEMANVITKTRQDGADAVADKAEAAQNRLKTDAAQAWQQPIGVHKK